MGVAKDLQPFLIKERKKYMNEELLEKIIKVLEDKKGIDIKVLDTKDKTTLADYFIVVSGTSNTHVRSLCDNVEEKLKQEKIYPRKIEGYSTKTWILMDYSDIVINIFTPEERQNYNLEELWEKATKII